MERVVEPWDPDLRGGEGREQLRGARIGEIHGDALPCVGNSGVRTLEKSVMNCNSRRGGGEQ